MAAPVRKAPPTQAPQSGAASEIRGWIALLIAAGVESFVAAYLGSDSAAEGTILWGEAVLLALLTCISLVAVLLRNGGAAYAVLGGLALLFLDGLSALLISVPMMAAGILFVTGTPRPRSLAAGLLVVIPLLVAVIMAVFTRYNLA